ncbi:MAG TPA: AMP-binding protein, partial [Polyangia bacterium]|nr:AMP-binding protein [Polyangia bacterium]
MKVGRHHYAFKTFRELDDESDRWAHALVAANITRGTKTLLMVKPSAELFTVLFALFKVGAVPVVVDPGMGLRRMLHCYRTVGADALVGIPAAHVVRALFPRSFASLKSWVTVGRKLGWSGPTLPPPAAFTPPAGPFPIAETRADDLLMINFTTGATGPAKGVEYTHGIADSMIANIESEFAHGPDDVALAPLPLFTAFHLLIGATTILPPIDPNRPALADAAAMIDTIGRFEVTHMFASPAFLRRVGDYAVDRHHKLPSLRRVISGGAPVLPSIARRFAGLLAADARLHVTYGATEALPIASITADELFGAAAGDPPSAPVGATDASGERGAQATLASPDRDASLDAQSSLASSLAAGATSHARSSLAAGATSHARSSLTSSPAGHAARAAQSSLAGHAARAAQSSLASLARDATNDERAPLASSLASLARDATNDERAPLASSLAPNATNAGLSSLAPSLAPNAKRDAQSSFASSLAAKAERDAQSSLVPHATRAAQSSL